MRRRLFLTLALIAAPLAAFAQSPLVYRIDVTGTVENGLAPYVARAIREAEAAGAQAVYLNIDTPGGRIDAAERISDAVRGASIPVYAFVNPRAFSAGALIAISANAVYMRPGGVMGAATPVDGQGTKASEKMVSAMRAEFRAVAEQRGLDPRIAEAMVDERVAVPGLVDEGRLLTLTTSEAIRVGYAKGEASSEAAMLQAAGLAGARGRGARPELGRAGGPLPHQPGGRAAVALARRPGARLRDQDRGVRPGRTAQPHVARTLLRIELRARSRGMGGDPVAGPRAPGARRGSLHPSRLRRGRDPGARRQSGSRS